MYLSNTDLMKVLPELDFKADVPEHEFDPAKQVQICSIDLRLSNVFWKQKQRMRTIDTHRSKLLEVHPRAYWRKVVLKPDQAITLEPQEFVLGRTLEKFRIPSRYAGKSATRSSYSRLGLETYCSCDLMNPGWHGYLPLEIINNSRFKIKLYPFEPICQLMLVALSSEPTGTYGDPKFGSKYQNDDGGPSYWWRDRYLKHLLTKIGARTPLRRQSHFGRRSFAK